MTRDLVAPANRNLIHGFELLATDMDDGELATFGDVVAASSGLPIPNFNRITVFEPPAPADLEEAVSWMAEREVPFQVTVASPALELVRDRAPSLGLEEVDDQPVMAMPSLADIPPRNPPVPIDPVTDMDGLETFVDVSAEIFGFPVEVARELVTEVVLEVEDLTFFVATEGGEPVGCGQLTRSGDVAGVYTIGVREGHRRRGIATAMSWEVLRRGRRLGCEVGVLQSSGMAVPVYEGMGFETVETYHDFHPAE